jgi:hypothetical protein
MAMTTRHGSRSADDNRAQFDDATGAVLDMLVTRRFPVAAEIANAPRNPFGYPSISSRAAKSCL